MDYDNQSEFDAEQLLMIFATRVQVLERLVQTLLIIQLRQSSDSQALIETLRHYALGGPAINSDFSEALEKYLIDLENIAHLKPSA